MAGGIAMVVILLLFPVIAAIGGMVIAAVLGSLLHRDGERRHEGSELVELNT
jgi:Na+/H+ antiporter NhaA